MKKKLLSLAVATAASVVFSDIYFQNLTGDNNLSNPENWREKRLPTSSENVAIVAGSFTAESDLNALGFNLSQNTELSLGSHTWYSANGTWNISGNIIFNGGKFVSTGGNINFGSLGNPYICVTNGAVIDTTYRVNIAWNATTDTKVHISGKGSKVLSRTAVQTQLGNNDSSRNALLWVNDGGYFETAANPYNISQKGSRNGVLVESGGKAVFNGYINIGRNNGYTSTTPPTSSQNENFIKINGGHVQANKNYVYIGAHGHSHSNYVSVVSNGLFETKAAVLIGAGTEKVKLDGTDINIGSSYNSLYVADGGVFSNAEEVVYIGYHSYPGFEAHDNTFTVGKNGNFISTGSVYVGYRGYGNSMTIDGATNITMNGGNIIVNHQSTASNNTFIAKNMKTLTLEKVTSGEQGFGAKAYFSNVTNLTFNVPSFVGDSGSHSYMEISGTTNFTYSTIRVGNNVGGSFSKLLIDGGENKVHFAGKTKMLDNIKMGDGSNCVIEVKNVVMTNGYARIFNSDDISTNSVIIFGKGSIFRCSSPASSPLGLVSPYKGTFIFDGCECILGSAGKNDGYVHFGINESSHNTLKIINNSTFSTKDSTSAIGSIYKTEGHNGHNHIYIGSGSYAEFYRLRANECSDLITLSNATLHITGEFVFPDGQNEPTKIATNNVIRFEGTSPRLTADVNITFSCNSQTIKDNFAHFDIPRGGYDISAPPVELENSNITLNSGFYITADISKFARGGGGKTLLMRANTIVIGNLETLQSKLPENCSLIRSADMKELWLKTPITGGTLIFIK